MKMRAGLTRRICVMTNVNKYISGDCGYAV